MPGRHGRGPYLEEVLELIRGMDDGQLLFFLGCLCPHGGIADLHQAMDATARYMPSPEPGETGTFRTRRPGTCP